MDRSTRGEVDDRVAAGEARRLLGHAIGPGHRVQQPRHVRAAWRTVLHAGMKRCLENPSGIMAGGDRLASEAVVQRLAIADLDLGVAGRQRRGLRGPARCGVGVEAAGDEGGRDLAAPLGPLPAQAGWDAGDLPLLVAALPADAEPTGQFRAQGGLVDAVRGLGMLKQQPAVERGAPAVRRLQQVDEDAVSVELGVAFARAAVRELRAQEAQIAAVLPVDTVPAEAGDARVGGEVADRRGLRLPYVLPSVVGGKRPQRRDRLRRRERDVPRRDPPVRPRLQRLTGRRVATFEDGAEVVRGDVSGEAEVLGEGAAPHPGASPWPA